MIEYSPAESLPVRTRLTTTECAEAVQNCTIVEIIYETIAPLNLLYPRQLSTFVTAKAASGWQFE
jgi:hypothetical protein